MTRTTTDQPISSRDLRVSLRYVIIAICFGTVCFSIIQGPALTGFARQLGANDFVFGLLMALPVLGGVVQILASYLIERAGTRRVFFLASLYPQRLIWIGVGLVPILLKSQTSRISTAIALISISSLCGSIGSVAFLSWMGDLVPKQARGKFWGTRSALATAVGVVSAWSVGWFLDQYSDFTGYSIVFIVAAVFGAIDIAFFHFIKEPPMSRSEAAPTLSQIASEPLKDRRFRKFVAFWCSTMFSYLILGPFGQVYLLEELGLGFKQVSLYTQVTTNIVILLAAKWWGVMIDRFGCKPVLQVGLAAQAAIPFLWLFTSANRWGLLLILNFITGFFWSALDLGQLNMVMRISPDRNRSAYVANHSLLAGILGNALSYLSAGAFLSVIRPVADSLDMTILGSPVTRFHFLFLLSGVLRLLVLLFVSPTLEDPESSSAGEMLRFVTRRLHGRTLMPSRLHKGPASDSQA